MGELIQEKVFLDKLFAKATAQAASASSEFVPCPDHPRDDWSVHLCTRSSLRTESQSVIGRNNLVFFPRNIADQDDDRSS